MPPTARSLRRSLRRLPSSLDPASELPAFFTKRAPASGFAPAGPTDIRYRPP
jgi:hypothetical protein